MVKIIFSLFQKGAFDYVTFYILFSLNKVSDIKDRRNLY